MTTTMDTNDSTIGPTQTTPAIDKGNKGEKGMNVIRL
jgi:hypothetical protein